MKFSMRTARKQRMIQGAFALFLVGAMIHQAEHPHPFLIPEIAKTPDTTTVIFLPMPDEIIESVSASAEKRIETGVNQTQTNKGKSGTPKVMEEKKESAARVPTHVQAENLLDQGYSVKDIASELGLEKKEVRQLKRKLRKEEKKALAQRKKENKKRKEE